MSYAKNFNCCVAAINRNEKGFYELPSGFISAWRDKAIRVEYPRGTNSLDPTELWHFKDGSSVWVGNPRQYCYPLSITVQ